MGGKSTDRKRRRRQPRQVRRNEGGGGGGGHGQGEGQGGSETTDTNETNETTDTNDDEQSNNLQREQQNDPSDDNVVNQHHHRHNDHHNQLYYVDQNRNLNLSELSEKDEEIEFVNNNNDSNINNNINNNNNHAKIDIGHKTSSATTDSQVAADLRHQQPCSRADERLMPLNRRQDNISPIESLSSEQSSSDCTTTNTTNVNNYGCRSSASSAASTSDIAAQRMSQTSLTMINKGSTNVLISNGSQESNNDQHDHHQRAQNHHKQVRFGQQQRRQHHVKIDMAGLVHGGHIDQVAGANGGDDGPPIERSDDLQKPQATVGDNFVIVPGQFDEHDQQDEHDDDKTNSTKDRDQGTSLVRQIGRRVSLLPQLVARRLSRGNSEMQNRYNSSYHHHHEDCMRRYSLPPASAGMGGGGGGGGGGGIGGGVDSDPDSSCALLSSCSGAGAANDTQPLATVAGVGGTITTVTRSKTKTAPLPRLVAKNGQVNLFLDNIDRRQYVRDLFTTMIDIKWRYNLMAAAFGFVFSWLFFACIWYIVLYFHDDLEHENDPTWSPCIVNVYSFPAALLFSIETQSTLGFGSRIISVECPGAIVIFCTQLIFGVVVECLIVGMVFAKLSRPTKRSQTIMYSKYATVCLRENKMCLTFRVGDVRSKSHIIGATIRASLVSSKTTKEGEIIPFYYYKLNVIIDDCKDSLLLIWPVTIVHVIDEASPFYQLNSDQLSSFKFEIITVLEGTVESTGQSIQVRSSYLPSEVKWGYRFEPIVSTHGYGRYAQTIIDYNKFNRIIEVPTPRCSPLDFYAAKDGQQQQQQQQQQQPHVEDGANGGGLADVITSN